MGRGPRGPARLTTVPSDAEHWDGVYRTRSATEVGWYEARPSTLADVLELAPDRDARIVDVGAGEGRLVDELHRRGYSAVTLLDLSATALEHVTARLQAAGLPAADVVVADARDVDFDGTVDLWHDRAVFHFLVTEDDQRAYVAAAARSIRTGGGLVVATFAPDGPDSCAGLPVCRYDAHGLAARFDPEFELVNCRTTRHAGRSGDRRPYVICRFRKRAPRAT